MVTASADRPLGWLWANSCPLDILGGPVRPPSASSSCPTTVAFAQEGPCVLVFEPSWRVNIVIVVSPPLGAVAALNKELARAVTMEEGSECNAAWFAWHNAWRAQEALLLRCTCLQVIANSSRGLVVRLAHHAWVDPDFRFGPARRGTAQPPCH